ncbi:MAG: transcription antitermination factor NusB [Proteobacteria bacterium]|nr:MAG: transcription antitermination factor NusB [Pseudomonadota bacterium]
MSRPPRAPRVQSRQAALQALYAVDVARRGAEEPLEPLAVEEALAELAAHFELPEGAREYARELAVGVARHRDAIDAQLVAHSTNWRIERMAVVDRNVLRLAIYEMGWLGLPPSVAIDEAVELARRFGADPSPAFVNGVLDAVAHSFAGRARAWETT